jgi:tetratricopeptide (TPR) repeat protein
MGRHDEALAVLRRAQSLDPISLNVHLGVGRALVFANRDEEAVEHLRATAEMEPRFAFTYAWLARALCNLGRYQEALIEIESGMRSAGRPPTLVTMAGYVYGMVGRDEDARRMIEALRQEGHGRYVSPVFEATIQLGLDNSDEYLRLLEQAVSQRSGWLAFIRLSVFPGRSIRRHPRFEALVEKLGLNF